MRARSLLVLVPVFTLFAGCSFSVGGADYGATAVKVIEGDLADEIGLGKLDATCDEVSSDAEVDDTFECTAETEDGDEIAFEATIESEKRVGVDTTNLITDDGLRRIESAAVAILENEVGDTLGDENFDCGDGPIIFDPQKQALTCELTDPGSGDLYDAEVELSDLTEDADINVTVAEEPKS